MKTKYLLLPLALLMVQGCTKKQAVDATGIFEATTVTVSAETAGRIMSLPISEGDTVRAGQLIAQIDTTALALQLHQVESQRAAAEASMPDVAAQAASLRSQIAHQQHECERLDNLLAAGATTRKQVDDANAALRTLRRQLDAQLSSLANSRGSVSGNVAALSYQEQQIEEQIAKSSVKAPAPGTVLLKLAEQGEYAVPGKPLVRLADMQGIYLRAYLTAAQLADIRVGQKVTVTADFGDDKRYDYPGTITWIAEESEFTPKSIQTPGSRANLVYAVKIVVPNDGRLKLGQYGEVKL